MVALKPLSGDFENVSFFVASLKGSESLRTIALPQKAKKRHSKCRGLSVSSGRRESFRARGSRSNEFFCMRQSFEIQRFLELFSIFLTSPITNIFVLEGSWATFYK